MRLKGTESRLKGNNLRITRKAALGIYCARTCLASEDSILRATTQESSLLTFVDEGRTIYVLPRRR